MPAKGVGLGGGAGVRVGVEVGGAKRARSAGSQKPLITAACFVLLLQLQLA